MIRVSFTYLGEVSFDLSLASPGLPDLVPSLDSPGLPVLAPCLGAGAGLSFIGCRPRSGVLRPRPAEILNGHFQPVIHIYIFCVFNHSQISCM